MKSKPYALKDLLPITVPFSIMIEPTNQCNFRCRFCPTGNYDLLKQVGRPIGSMKYDFFVKIIDDLRFMCEANDSKVKRLHLYKDGEPLLNKDLGKMIAYAKKQGVSESIEITTNGAILETKRVIELIEGGLDAMRISVEHTTDIGYREITQTFGNYAKIKSNVEFLFKEKERRISNLKIHVKILDSGLSDEEKEQFIADFSPISDSLNIDQIMGWSRSDVTDFKLGRTVTTGMGGITEIKERLVCPEAFSKLAVNFDGTTSICCVDWSHGTVVGDLRTQSLTEIWAGEKLRTFRLLHLSGKRSQIDACSNCDYLRGLTWYSNLDDDTDRLLQVYSKT